LVHKTLAVSIVFLFIASTVTPAVISYDEPEEDDDCLDNLAFMCYDGRGDNAKYEYYKEHLLNDYPKDDVGVVEPVEKTISDGLPPPFTTGLMNSSWPMKCHDLRHTSRSPYSTAGNSGFEKWRFRSEKDGAIESSAIIGDDGTIYFGTMGSDHRLYALYPNGTKKWEYELEDIIWSTPAIAEDGTIYVTSWDYYLHAVNPNGTLKWKFPVDVCSSSPAIGGDGTIYFGVMGPGYNGRIYAVNPDGSEKWHYDTGYWIISHPAVGDDGTVYIGSGDCYFYAINQNGTLKWRFRTGGHVKGHPSIAEDGTIFIPSYDGYLYALYPNGTMKWKVDIVWGAMSSAAIGEDGTLYIGTDKLRAIYPNNGTVKWSLDVGRISYPSPAISLEGTIYICNHEGKCIVAISPDGFELWRRQIGDERADSSPCIGEDGTIYVGSTWRDPHTHILYGYLHALVEGELEVYADGPYYGLINVPVQFSGFAIGGYPPYIYHWDFGDGNTSNEQNPGYIYSSPGDYIVTLTVTDDSGNVSDNSTFAHIQISNDPPDIPSIDGETEGTIHVEYEYTFVTSDVDGNDVWYYIDWGDDTFEEWIGPYPSGEEITRSHTWNERDTYTIRCKAKDPYDAEGEWGTLEVTMPVNQPVQYPLLELFRQRFPLLYQILNRVLEVNLFEA